MAENSERISIGYALPSKKTDSFITQSLITHAKQRGIDFIPINLNQPLIQQSPFHCIIHKIYSDDWNQQLLDFQSKNPNTPIIDSPTAIQLLHDRISMLKSVENLHLPPSTAAVVGIPKQVLLEKDSNEEQFDLKFPVIAKPLVANGTLNSHQMSVVFNSNGLKKVKQEFAPIVLQEFVNHGGVLFKIYVAGCHVRCVQRKSLPDFHVSDFDHPFFVQFEEEGVMPFSQISNLPNSEKQQKADDVEMPDLEFVKNLGTALREATNLNLFNFDLIRDESDSSGNKYLIIDINYFPGFSKLPEFEAMMTDFFLDVVGRRRCRSEGENA